MDKLRLTVNALPWPGYLNIDPVRQPCDDIIRSSNVDFRMIENFVKPREFYSVIADNVLEYIPYKDIEAFIGKLVALLRIGGQLVINGVEVLDLVRMLHTNLIDIREYNIRTFGAGVNHPWSYKSSTTSMFDVEEILKKYGLKIVKKSLDNGEFSITGERVE